MPWFTDRKTKSCAEGSTAAVGVGFFYVSWVCEVVGLG